MYAFVLLHIMYSIGKCVQCIYQNYCRNIYYMVENSYIHLFNVMVMNS